MSEALLKFLLKRIYGLKEDVGWRISWWLFSAWPSLMCKCGDFAISESPYCGTPSINFTLKRIYGLEEDVGWRIPKWLCSAWLSLMWDRMIYAISPCCQNPSSNICARDYMVRKEMVDEEFKDGWIVHGHLWCVNGVIFAILESPYCWNPSIKFLIKRIYGLEEDVGWRIRRWLFTAWPSLMCEWDDICYFWVAIMSEAFLKFFLRKRIYSLEGDGGWRIQRWLLSTWPSLISERGDFSYFWVSILQEAFHQFSDQEKIWFRRRCCLKNSKVAVNSMAIFSVWMGLISYSGSPYYQKPEGSEQENIWFCRRCWLKNYKMAV